MPADPAEEKISVAQQAINSLQYLDAEDQQKVLEYIVSLIQLSEINHDQASPR